MNNVVLVGRAGRDPEQRFFESGKQKTTVSIAIDRPTKEKTTDWIDLEAWDKTGEIMAEYVRKGTQIAVSGSLQQQTWEQDGQKRSKLIVNVQRLQLLGKRPDGSLRDQAAEVFDGEELPF